MTLSFEVPLPPAPCSPNSRHHWREVAKAKKAYRGVCAFCVRDVYRQMRGQGREVPTPPVYIHLDFYMAPQRGDGRYRPHDEDNARASFKAGLDGLTDAGVFPDDSAQHVRAGQTRLHSLTKAHLGRACVVVTIQDVENEESRGGPEAAKDAFVL